MYSAGDVRKRDERIKELEERVKDLLEENDNLKAKVKYLSKKGRHDGNTADSW